MLVRMIRTQVVPDEHGIVSRYVGGQEYDLPEEIAKELTGSNLAHAVQKEVKNEPSPRPRNSANGRAGKRRRSKKLSKN